jgi:hypothetical protein
MGGPDRHGTFGIKVHAPMKLRIFGDKFTHRGNIRTAQEVVEMFNKLEQENERLEKELAALKEKMQPIINYEPIKKLLDLSIDGRPLVTPAGAVIMAFENLEKELAGLKGQLKNCDSIPPSISAPCHVVTLLAEKERELAELRNTNFSIIHKHEDCASCKDKPEKAPKFPKPNVARPRFDENQIGLASPGKTEFVELDEETINFEIPDDDGKGGDT